MAIPYERDEPSGSGATPGPGGPSLAPPPSRRRRRRRRGAAPSLAESRALAVSTARLQPVPRILSDHDIPSVAELNRRVEAIVYAHQRALGRRISPGLAYDLVRVPLADHEYQRMFTVDPTRVRHRSILRYDSQDFAAELGLVHAVGGPTLGGAEGGQFVGGPTLGNPIVGLSRPGDPTQVLVPRGGIQTPEMYNMWARSQYLARMGVIGGDNDLLFLQQIVEGLESTPGGIAYMGKAVGLDTRDVFSELTRRGLGAVGIDIGLKKRDITPGRSVEVAQMTWDQTVDMFNNPGANPGNLFLFGVGFLVPTVGAPARLAAAGSAFGKEGFRAAGRALATRPLPGTVELVAGGMRAHVLLSENIVWRNVIQKPRLARQQATLTARYGGDRVGPGALTDAPEFGGVRGMIRWTFSPERRLTKNFVDEQRYLSTIRQAPLNEIQRFSQWNVQKHIVMENVNNIPWLRARHEKSIAALSKLPGFKNRTTTERRLAIEKAIEVLATDAWDPLAVHREFHNRMLRTLTGDPEAHQAHLDLLDLAEDILDNPPAELMPLYEAMRRAISHREQLAKMYAGVSQARLVRRIAAHGAIFRGEFTKRVRGEEVEAQRAGKVQRADYTRLIKRRDKEVARLKELQREREKHFRLPTDWDYQFVPGKIELSEAEGLARLDRMNAVYERLAAHYGGAEQLQKVAFFSDIEDPQLRKLQRFLQDRAKLQMGIATRHEDLASLADLDLTERIEPTPLEADVDLELQERITAEPDPDILREVRRDLGVYRRAIEIQEGAPVRPKNKIDQRAARLARDFELRELTQTYERLARDLNRMGGGDPLERLVEKQSKKIQHTQVQIENLLDRFDQSARLELEVTDPMDRASYAIGYQPFYTPQVSIDRSQPQMMVDNVPGSASIGPYGVNANTSWSDFDHVLTGNTAQSGRYRVDMTTLVHGSVRKAIKTVERMELAAAAWSVARELPARAEVPKGWIPIRSVDSIPDELRDAVRQVVSGELRWDTWEKLGDPQIDAIRRHLFPDDITQPDGNPNVRWVDERFILWNDPNDWKMVEKIASGIGFIPNEFYRVTNLFLKPAYALNALGAEMQAIIQQGFLAPESLGRALLFKHKWGEDAHQVAQDLVEAGGRSASYHTDSYKRTPSSVLYKFWIPITDRHQRVSALVYEFRREGIKDDQMRYALGLEGEVDVETRQKVINASRRAQKAMVNFKLTNFERAVLRHIFFVYAWTSRSAVWGINTMIDHPTVTAALVALGQLNQEELDRELGKAHPSWFDRSGGLLYVGEDPNGVPLKMDWRQLSAYTTIPELANQVQNMVTGMDYVELEEMFGGWMTIFMRGASGKDEFGVPYEGGALIGAAKSIFGDTSFGALVRRLEGDPDNDKPLPPIDVLSDEASLTKMLSGTNPYALRERAAARQTPFRQETWEETWGSILWTMPVGVNEESLAGDYWSKQPIDERLKHEYEQITKVVEAQAKLMGVPVTDALYRAMAVAFRADSATEKWHRDNGVWPTDYDKGRIWLGAMLNEGAISKDEHKTLTQQLRESRSSPQEVNAMLAKIKDRAGDGAITEWTERKNAFAVAYDPNNLIAAADVFARYDITFDAGVLNAGEKPMRDFARAYVTYVEEEARQRQALKDGDITKEDYNEWLLSQDKPIRTSAGRFPSGPEMQWAAKPEDDRIADVYSHANDKYWNDVEPFFRKILGRPSTETIAAAWTEIGRLKTEYRNAGHGNVSDKQLLNLARQMERDPRYKGIYQDVLYALEPGYRRFQLTTVYQRSQHRRSWDEILDVAAEYSQMRYSGRYRRGDVDTAWEQVLNESLLPWAEGDEAFMAEVEAMGITWLKDLIE